MALRLMYSEAPILAMGTPVLVTLFTGLLIAFAMQLLLTTFGVAAGITAIGYLPGASSDSSASTSDTEYAIEDEAESGSGTAGKIGFAVGAGTLLTVNTVLFVASFLAVKLSLVSSVTLGAVLGVVIWSGYFLVLTWLSSRAAGSLLGVLAGAVSSGMQGLIATVTAALGRDRTDGLPKTLDKRMAATESTLETIQTQLDTTNRNLEATLQDYVQTLQPPTLDMKQIRHEMAEILASTGLPSVVQGTGNHGIDRQALIDLVSSRTDFSKHDVNQVVEQLEDVWQETTGGHDAIADLTTFFQSASPDTLTPDAVNARLSQLRSNTQSHESTHGQAESVPLANVASIASLEPKQLVKQLARTVRDRVDLSDLDVGKILQQLQTFTQSSEPSSEASSPINPISATIQSDVEDYLLNAYPWNLTRKTVKAEFKDVIYDPEANPTAVQQQLLSLGRDAFVTLLEQRDDLTPKKVEAIADRLQETRQEVLDSLEVAIAEAPSNAFQTQVADYLRSAEKPALEPDRLEQQLQTLLQKSEHKLEHWSDRLRSLNRNRLVAILNVRQDLDQTELDALTTQLKTVRDRLLTETQERQAELASEAANLWQKLGDYVSDRNQKLTARNIQRQTKALAKTATTELDALRAHLPPFDDATVTQWLADREDLSEKQRQRILSQLENAWNSLLQVPQATADAARSSYDQVLTVLTDYLQHIDPSTFNVADLPQDLLRYLAQHHLNIDTLGQLTSIDWAPLVEQVQQRQDLTAEQQRQLLDQIQRTIYTLGKLPRRFALRTKRQVQTWQDTLSDYLRHADRDDLSVDRPPQFVQHLLDSVQASDNWVETLQNHLPDFDRTHLAALLSERGDLTEGEVSHIIEQWETIVQRAIGQAQTLQQQAQETIATTFDQLRHYITSLPLPELDTDRVKNDLQQLIVDPRVGLESLSSSVGETLRDQPSTLNRHTLSALLSARDDLSETFAHQLVDRIDAVRLGAINQITTAQQEAQRRAEELKQQVQRQANETRKAIAIAAWWLFATALSSALTAAIAGALAVGGIEWIEQIVS